MISYYNFIGIGTEFDNIVSMPLTLTLVFFQIGSLGLTTLPMNSWGREEGPFESLARNVQSITESGH